MARNVLLIGANSGLGRAVARKLIGRGDSVTALVSQQATLEQFERDIPGSRRVLALDLADAEGVRDFAATLIPKVTPLNAVVFCAAVSPFAPAEMSSLDEFRRTLEINCISLLAVYQSAMPALRRGGGRLVITSSLSGRVATPMMGAYVASKFALEGLADVMRQEASEWGVPVIVLQPGTMDTPVLNRSRDALAARLAALSESERALYGRLYRQMLYRVEEALAAGGLMRPEVVADAVIEAIDSPHPLPRYRIGADAEFLIEASRTKSDREIDAIILDLYRSAPI
jgi:NAD(P)-dependent dehydrogenase (short-subunit alcohol dehydrogenase family)